MKKCFIIIFVMMLTIFVAFTTYVKNENFKTRTLKMSELINRENINDLSLTIYYVSPYVLTDIPLNINDIMTSYDHKIVIDGNQIKKHMDLFTQIGDVRLKKVDKSYLNCRMYYIIESKKNGKLLDVAMWTSSGGMLVNGYEVEADDALYDIIIPFLPKELANELQLYVASISE